MGSEKKMIVKPKTGTGGYTIIFCTKEELQRAGFLC